MSMRNDRKVRFPRISPKRRDVLEMMSDYFREVSVLVLVFGLLESHRNGERLGWYDIMIIGISFATFVTGVIFEGLRK